MQDGELGQVQLIRAYRMQPVGDLGKKPADEKELFWQIRNFVHFLWVSGGLFAEMNIHQIDELCWIKDSWPVTAHGIGGRAANSTDCSQNLDSLSIEWTFADGTKALDVVRWLPKCHEEFATYIHGTKCAAQFSGPHHLGTVQIYKDQRCSPGQHRLARAEGAGHALASRVDRPARRHPQRQAPQRSQTRRHVQPGRPHGPRRRPYRPGRHLGPDDGLQLPVLPEH